MPQSERVALITGYGKAIGIGNSTARALAGKGIAVISSDARCYFAVLLIPLLIMLPAKAVAQSTTKYDGTYAGVSRKNAAEVTHNECTHGGNSYTLTIRNGEARMPWGTSGTLVGSVGPTGKLAMQGWGGSVNVHIYGQIDVNGTVTAGASTGGCSYDMVWQKR